jgi:general secretion pathway protein G
MMRFSSGFISVKISIMVVILGVLAAIVVPQFAEATGENKEARLLQDVQSVRSQIELYKLQHAGKLPGAGVASVVAALTGMTDIVGDAADAPGPGVYGPYLEKIPANPFVPAGIDGQSIEEGTTNAAGGQDNGWFLNTVTGAFFADDDDHNTL